MDSGVDGWKEKEWVKCKLRRGVWLTKGKWWRESSWSLMRGEWRSLQ